MTLAGLRLTADGLMAWEHELDENPLVLASFQTAPGANFILRGNNPAHDTALVGAGLRSYPTKGLTFGIRSDVRLGARTTIYSGTADLTYRW